MLAIHKELESITNKIAFAKESSITTMKQGSKLYNMMHVETRKIVNRFEMLKEDIQLFTMVGNPSFGGLPFYRHTLNGVYF